MTSEHVLVSLALVGIMSLATGFASWVAMDNGWAGCAIFTTITACGCVAVWYSTKGETK